MTSTPVSSACRAVAVLAMFTALGCAPESTPNVEEGSSDVNTLLTEVAAQERLIELMTLTLGDMPEGAFLSTVPGTGAAVPVTTTVPCDDQDQSGEGPVNVGVYLWVLGISEGDDGAVLDAVESAWAARSWSPVADDDGRRVYGYAGGDNVLVIQSNPMAGVSLTGSSPCFPRANVGGAPLVPRTIARPR